MSQVEWPDFDSDGADVDKLQNQPTVDKTGKYHMEIVLVKERPEPVGDKGENRCPDILVMSQVAEPVKGQSPAGSIFFHHVRIGGSGGGPPSQGTRDSTLAFLLGLGILIKRDGKVIDPETNSTRLQISTLADRIRSVKQFIADVRFSPASDGFPEKYELPYGKGAYLVTDPLVSNVPKNKSLLAGISSAASFGYGANTNSNAPAGQSAPQATARIPADF